MIRVCPFCSNVDVDNLKSVFGEENVKTGCIGNCRAYKTEANAIVNGEIVIKESEQELIEYCKNN